MLQDINKQGYMGSRTKKTQGDLLIKRDIAKESSYF